MKSHLFTVWGMKASAFLSLGVQDTGMGGWCGDSCKWDTHDGLRAYTTWQQTTAKLLKINEPRVLQLQPKTNSGRCCSEPGVVQCNFRSIVAQPVASGQPDRTVEKSRTGCSSKYDISLTLRACFSDQ